MSFKGWRTVKLGEVGSIVTGKTPSTKKEYYFGGEYLFITPRDMVNEKKIISTERTLSEAGIDSVSKQLIRGKSICVSCIGSDMGKVVICNKDGVTNQQINSITNIKNEYDINFIYYTLKPMKEYLHNIAGGSTMPIVNKSTFSEIEIRVPSIEEQKAIAKILSDLDDKIEVNNKINKNLEEMAQAIFKQWFVDFEFPNEEGRPYKSSGGEMVESELGMIPKGWNVSNLSKIAEYLNGLAMQKFRPNDNEESLKVLKIKELRQGRTDKNSDLCSVNIDNKYIIRDGDVIFSWSGSLLIDIWCGGECGLNQHLFKVSSKEYAKWFYYLWTNHHLHEFIKIAEGKATTMGHIKRDDLEKAKVLIPQKQELEKMNKMFSSIIEKIIKTKIESVKIEGIRDTLLPKLMSGEIRVNIDK